MALTCARLQKQVHLKRMRVCFLLSASQLNAHLRHEAAGLGVQQLRLGARIQQEGEGAEGEGPIHGHAVVGGVVSLPPCHIVVLHIQLLTVTQIEILVSDVTMP